jgi:geranylgeranyl diphosphate synthase type II
MFNLTSYIKSKQDVVNKVIDEALQVDTHPTRILEAMRYSITAGGKRIRPILCMAAAEAVGGNASDTLEIGCAIEMIHTYSLIHDDLPAMDNDALRRGKPTSHVRFDEATAILAGDALLTLAFQILSTPTYLNKNRSIDHLRIIQILAKAAGYQGMIAGQMDDIQSEGKAVDLDELRKIHSLKTGALVQASVLSGAVAGAGAEQEIEILGRYGRLVGLAFQVADDILNVQGDPSRMGKAVGTDAEREKSTYPALMGMQASEDYAAALVQKAVQSIAMFDAKADPLRAIANYVIERKR